MTGFVRVEALLLGAEYGPARCLSHVVQRGETRTGVNELVKSVVVYPGPPVVINIKLQQEWKTKRRLNTKPIAVQQKFVIFTLSGTWATDNVSRVCLALHTCRRSMHYLWPILISGEGGRAVYLLVRYENTVWVLVLTGYPVIWKPRAELITEVHDLVVPWDILHGEVTGSGVAAKRHTL